MIFSQGFSGPPDRSRLKPMAAQQLKSMKPAMAKLMTAIKEDMATLQTDHTCSYFAAKYPTPEAKQELLVKVAELIPVPADITKVLAPLSVTTPMGFLFLVLLVLVGINEQQPCRLCLPAPTPLSGYISSSSRWTRTLPSKASQVIIMGIFSRLYFQCIILSLPLY